VSDNGPYEGFSGGVPQVTIDHSHNNTIGFADAHRGWAVGKEGLILKFEGTVPGGVETKKLCHE
jgi:hypothetical protein